MSRWKSLAFEFRACCCTRLWEWPDTGGALDKDAWQAADDICGCPTSTSSPHSSSCFLRERPPDDSPRDTRCANTIDRKQTDGAFGSFRLTSSWCSWPRHRNMPSCSGNSRESSRLRGQAKAVDRIGPGVSSWKSSSESKAVAVGGRKWKKSRGLGLDCS